jgi:hypothetical protein
VRGQWLPVAIGGAVGLALAGAMVFAKWWRRDPEAEQREQHRIVLRRLRGEGDEEEWGGAARRAVLFAGSEWREGRLWWKHCCRPSRASRLSACTLLFSSLSSLWLAPIRVS